MSGSGVLSRDSSARVGIRESGFGRGNVVCGINIHGGEIKSGLIPPFDDKNRYLGVVYGAQRGSYAHEDPRRAGFDSPRPGCFYIMLLQICAFKGPKQHCVLELEAILRMPLSNAEFVFLAACQSAMGDFQLINESFHLGGGFTAAGF
ncbi:hypothetical protein DFH09DRAFT_1078629 [Mycena vulgaris]|nr:hypothetical protein DFH09DRAFT_1078629 [Mycena vulgaris]